MTDEELIARLRNDHPDYLTSAAADKIEALTAEVRRWHGLFDEKHNLMLEQKARAERAEAERDVVAALLSEARIDLEIYITNEYPKDEHPYYARQWAIEMELCRKIDAALAKIKEGRL